MLTIKKANQQLRKELKAAFPETKFSVKKGSSSTISITWEDGASKEDVQAIANKYWYGSYDSYTGTYSNKSETSVADYINYNHYFSREVLEPFLQHELGYADIRNGLHQSADRIEPEDITIEWTKTYDKKHDTFRTIDNDGLFKRCTVRGKTLEGHVYQLAEKFGNFEAYEQHLEDERARWLKSEAEFKAKQNTVEEKQAELDKNEPSKTSDPKHNEAKLSLKASANKLGFTFLELSYGCYEVSKDNRTFAIAWVWGGDFYNTTKGTYHTCEALDDFRYSENLQISLTVEQALEWLATYLNPPAKPEAFKFMSRKDK